jgi:hypothetical protein
MSCFLRTPPDVRNLFLLYRVVYTQARNKVCKRNQFKEGLIFMAFMLSFFLGRVLPFILCHDRLTEAVGMPKANSRTTTGKLGANHWRPGERVFWPLCDAVLANGDHVFKIYNELFAYRVINWTCGHCGSTRLVGKKAWPYHVLNKRTSLCFSMENSGVLENRIRNLLLTLVIFVM